MTKLKMIDKDTILKTLGYDALTPMQEAMLQVGANPGGVVLLSPTGTGKTLGYLLPAVRQIDLKLDVLQVVVVVPTRELAVQCEMALKSMKTGARSLSLYGGRPTMEEHRKLREVQPHIVLVHSIARRVLPNPVPNCRTRQLALSTLDNANSLASSLVILF